MNIGTQAIAINSSFDPLPGSQSAATPVRSQPPAPKEDNVQLSAEAQKALASSSPAPSAVTQPTLNEIIRRAADGDIAALAQLALV